MGILKGLVSFSLVVPASLYIHCIPLIIFSFFLYIHLIIIMLHIIMLCIGGKKSWFVGAQLILNK